MKEQNFKGFQIKDSRGLSATKDTDNDKSLLNHIMRKVLKINPSFAGFSQDFLNTLKNTSNVEMEELEKGLDVLETQCR